jgi:hypothetical protein
VEDASFSYAYPVHSISDAIRDGETQLNFFNFLCRKKEKLAVEGGLGNRGGGTGTSLFVYFVSRDNWRE